MCKVYISGPITGVPDYEGAFKAHAFLLARMGYAVVDPTSVSIEGGTWEQYMQNDLGLLRKCDAISMLVGWEASKGACIERRFAKKLGLKFV